MKFEDLTPVQTGSRTCRRHRAVLKSRALRYADLSRSRPGAGTMASDSEQSAFPWERYRRYVTVLAQTQLDPRWRGKVDLSGVVQQTLLEAHQAATGLRAKEDGQRLAWLRRILSNNLADELRKWTS